MVSEGSMKICFIHVLLISAGVTTTAVSIRLDQPESANDLTNITIELDYLNLPDFGFENIQEKLADELIAWLEKTDLEEIADILSDPPAWKYDAVNARLKAVHERRLGGDSGWLLRDVARMELGDQKPSSLLQRIRNLAKYASIEIPDATLREMWMNKLSRNVRIALVIRETMSECTVEDLATIADKLMEFKSIQNQLQYIQGHMKPSEILTSMQILDSDTPDAVIQHTLIKVFPSFVGTSIAVWESMNNESTLENMAVIADITMSLKRENDRQLNNFRELLNIERNNYGDENPSSFLERMRSLTEKMTPIHVWMYYLPEYMREAIIVKQALNYSSTIEDLTELADKLQDLK